MSVPTPPVLRPPPEAVPFVQELLVQLLRRMPAFLGRPPLPPLPDQTDPGGCAEAVQAVLAWLAVAPDGLGLQIEEMEHRFSGLREDLDRLEDHTRRLIRSVRSWVEDGEGFSHALSDAIRGACPEAGHGEFLASIDHQLRAKAEWDRREADGILAQASGLRETLDLVRARVGQVEAVTRELRSQSLRDPLTGLWNRRALDDRLVEEIARSERYRTPFTLVLWDVDRLEEVNGRLGPEAGDRVLQTLASRSLQVLRRSDFLARFEQDTFAVLLPNTGVGPARIAAGKICRAAADEPVAVPGGTAEVTTSAGIASWTPGTSPEVLYARARDALAEAARQGGDWTGGAPVLPDLSVPESEAVTA